MELTAGTLINQSIRLVKRLGEGGMGTVWVAEHLTLNTTVAVKFILETAKRDPRRITRFKREASIAAKIRNPHVVQIFDYGVMQDGTPYIVMELMEGHTLSDRLKREPLSLAETKLLVSQVAIALTAAHELDITHRDLKPDNLFLIKKSGYDLFVKVLDFGIAKQRNMPSGMTSPGAMMGTPMYMSPEQIESADDVTHHADLWALAVVAYQALLGRPPFEGETMGALCINISKAEFEPVTSALPDLPEEIDEWFSCVLSRTQSERYQTALDLAGALDAIGGESPARSSLVPSAPVLISPAPHSSRAGSAGPNSSGSNSSGPNSAGPDSSGPDSSAASEAAPDSSGAVAAATGAGASQDVASGQRRWRVPLALLLFLVVGSVAVVLIKPQASEVSPNRGTAADSTSERPAGASPSNAPASDSSGDSTAQADSSATPSMSNAAGETPPPDASAAASGQVASSAPSGIAAPPPAAKATGSSSAKTPCRRQYMEGDTVKERPCPDGKAPTPIKPSGAPSVKKPCEGELFINEAGVVERRPC